MCQLISSQFPDEFCGEPSRLPRFQQNLLQMFSHWVSSKPSQFPSWFSSKSKTPRYMSLPLKAVCWWILLVLQQTLSTSLNSLMVNQLCPKATQPTSLPSSGLLCTCSKKVWISDFESISFFQVFSILGYSCSALEWYSLEFSFIPP